MWKYCFKVLGGVLLYLLGVLIGLETLREVWQYVGAPQPVSYLELYTSVVNIGFGALIGGTFIWMSNKLCRR